MRKSPVIAVLALLMIPSLAFAGGGGEEPAPEGPVTVTLGYNAFLSSTFTDAPAPIDAIRAELARQYPNIVLEYETMAQDLLDTLIIWMTSQDTTVDIYGIDEPWVTQFGRAGWAVPLNEALPGLDERFSESGLETFSYEGDRLGVPFWGSVTGLYYRTDILDEYGFEPPETIDEMVQIIQAVQAEDPEISGFLWPGARDEDLVMYYSTLLHAFGGSYLNADGSYAFDSEASREALEFMRQSIETGISPQVVQNWKRNEARQRFAGGNGIFLWDNNDLVIWLDDPEQSQISGNWDLMPFPAQPDGEEVSITGGFAFAVNPFSENQEAAMRVMEVISSEAVQKGFALAWGPVQYFDGLYEDPEVQNFNPNVDRLIPLLERATNRPPSESYAQLSGMLQEELNAAVTGTRSIDSVLASIAERAQALRD
jgi:multiple sugar transport system substrate-binding protein